MLGGKALSLEPLEYYMHLFTKVYITNKDKLHIFRMIFYRQVSILPVNPDVIPFFKLSPCFLEGIEKINKALHLPLRLWTNKKTKRERQNFVRVCVCADVLLDGIKLTAAKFFPNERTKRERQNLVRVCLRCLRTHSEKAFNHLVFKTMARVLYEKP